MTRHERLRAALLALLMVLASDLYVVSRLGPVHGPELVLEADHYKYIEMVRLYRGEAVGRLAHDAPFCYRLLTPWLVSLVTESGLGIDLAFYLVTQLFLVLFLYTLHAYLRLLGLPPRHALLGLVLAGLVPGAVRWYAYQYWMTDPLSLFLVTLALILIESERHRLLVAVSLVAVLNRETYLLVFPYLFLRTWQRRSPAAALAVTARVAALPLLALAAIHALVPANPGPDRGLGALVARTVAWRWRKLWQSQLYFATVGSFGVLLPALLLRPRKLGRWLGHDLPRLAVVLAAYASLLVANNTDRLLAYALPVLLPVALANLRAIEESGILGWRWLCAATLAPQAYFFLVTRSVGYDGASVRQPFNGRVVALMLLYWLGLRCLIAWRLGRGRPRPRPIAAPLTPERM